MQTIVSIPGIHCGSCASIIKDVSSEFPAITKAEVNVETKTVTLEHGDDFDFQQWKSEIEAIDKKYAVFSL